MSVIFLKGIDLKEMRKQMWLRKIVRRKHFGERTNGEL